MSSRDNKEHELIIARLHGELPYVAYHTAFKGTVVSADTRREAVIELTKSIGVHFLYMLDKGEYSTNHLHKTEEE